MFADCCSRQGVDRVDGRLSKKDFGNLVKKLGMPSLTDKNGSTPSRLVFPWFPRARSNQIRYIVASILQTDWHQDMIIADGWKDACLYVCVLAVQSIFRMADTDESGAVDWSEFANLLVVNVSHQ